MSTDKNEINEIVARCQKGDDAAFTTLVDRYSGRCYGYFYRLCGNNDLSNELLSKLFLKLVRKIGSYRGGSFENWLFTIASNLFNDYLRHRYRQQRLIEGKVKEVERQTPRTKTETAMIDDLNIQLEKLDPETAELIMLRYYGGLSFKELAEMRSEPIGTTLSKVHRGLKKLRTLMERVK
jgi:RNA polymerase sigma-70 factor (ECF subfamily)